VAAPPPQPRIWILPNRRTPGLAAVLVGMWYAGASQGNAAAYLLCFLLVGLALVSVIHAWANLRGISVRAEMIPPVFAGEDLVVPILISSSRRKPHFALEMRARSGKTATTLVTLDSSAPQRVEIRRSALRRGCFHELPVRLVSSFPLGFFTARQAFVIQQVFHVYPAPRGTLPMPHALVLTRQPASGTRIAGDDYGGVRGWQPGESQRHIDWKAAARGQPLLTKQWTGEADEILRFDWQSLASLDPEARLRQLAKWIVLAERGPAAYELYLPGKIFSAGRGDTHYHGCLRALAEFKDRSDEETA